MLFKVSGYGTKRTERTVSNFGRKEEKPIERCPTIKELEKTLGKDYRITIIDWEKVLYRDFGNGFNVEISGVSRANSRKPATIYLWFGDKLTNCVIAETVKGVGRSADAIDKAVNELYEHSQKLIAKGYANRDSQFKMKHLCYEGGIGL